MWSKKSQHVIAACDGNVATVASKTILYETNQALCLYADVRSILPGFGSFLVGQQSDLPLLRSIS